jgi:hypothetical protein
MSFANSRRRRKTLTILWIAILAIGIVSLIYWEMTALLYILATLGVTALLIIVALTDLTGSEKSSLQIPKADEAAAGTGSIGSTFGNKPS